MNEKGQVLSDYLPSGQLPEIGVPYWVQCYNFRCMAIFDRKGKWKSLFTDEELSDVINVFVN
ncbi:MAG: hypothetical protein ABR955_08590 [Verrucomicrobiota bacterium]|jgi:hypothetical protein